MGEELIEIQGDNLVASIPMEVVEPLVVCDGHTDRNKIVSQAWEQGYLLFKGLLPVETVLEVRRDVLKVLESHGYLDNEFSADEGICRPGAFVNFECPSPPPDDVRIVFNALHGLRSFNAFFHQPAVVEIITNLLGSEIFVHPRVICHVLFPGHLEHTAEPHQDFAPVRGTEHTWTAWTPLGDCGDELGGVAVSPGSHKEGLRDPQQLTDGSAFETAPTWAWSPLEAGDVLIFNSLTVHQGRDNVTENRIRLSTSARYQPVSEPVDALALLPQRRWSDWEGVYEAWDSDDPLKYYWKRLSLNIQSNP